MVKKTQQQKNKDRKRRAGMCQVQESKIKINSHLYICVYVLYSMLNRILNAYLEEQIHSQQQEVELTLI